MDQRFTLSLQPADARTAPQLISASAGAGRKGQPLKIAVPASTRVEIIEESSKAGPKRIRVKRVGNDLQVSFEGADTQPDVILENFYREDGARELYGRDGSGTLRDYTAEHSSGSKYAGVSAQDAPSFQVLDLQSTVPYWGSVVAANAVEGGAAAGTGAAAGLGGWAIAAAGLGLAGLGVAAGGGGGGSGRESPASVAPAQPSAVFDFGADGSKAANVTRDPTPKIAGVGTPGMTIEVVLAGQTLTTTVAADGTWSVTPPAALADGTYPIQVRQINAQGVASEPATGTLTIDTAAPSAAATIAIDSDSGPDGDGTTSDPTPTITGTGTPGDEVKVVVGGQTLTTVVDANGKWSVTPTTLADGTYTAEVTVTDTAGNSASSSLPLSIDTAAPAAPGLVTVAAGPSIGAAELAAAGGLLVSVPLPAGAAAGDVITVNVNGTNVTRTVTADDLTPGGSVSVLVPTSVVTARGDGPLTISTTYADAAGNATEPATTNLTLDTQASASSFAATVAAGPDIGLAELLAADETGGLPVAVPLPAGAAAGDVITVTVNGQEVTHTVTDEDIAAGEPVTLFVPVDSINANGDGDVVLTTTYTDVAGNATAPSTTNLRLDTQAPSSSPAVTVAAGPDIGAAELAAAAAAGGLPVTVPLPAGAAAGDVITVNVNGTNVTRTVTADDINAGAPLTVLVPTANITANGDGDVTLTTTYADAAGNAAAAVITNLVLDTAAPTAPVITVPAGPNLGAAELAAADDAGGLPVSVPLPAGAAEGDVITVTVNDEVVTRNVTADDIADGVPLTVLVPVSYITANGDGEVVLTTTYTDVAGNSSTEVTSNLTVDTVINATADSVSITEDAASATGNVLTNDTPADGSEVVSLVTSANVTYGSLSLASDGSYTYTRNATNLNGLQADTQDSFTYRVTDAAGNTTTQTLAVNITPVNDAPQIVRNTFPSAISGGADPGVGPTWSTAFSPPLPNTTAGAYVSYGGWVFDNGTSASLTQAGVSGWNVGSAPSGAAQLSFDFGWNNRIPDDGAEATVTISVGGVAYATVTTGVFGSLEASVSYVNGASGRVTTIEGNPDGGYGSWPLRTTVLINLPSGVSAVGDLAFSVNTLGQDDLIIDNVELVRGALSVYESGAITINGRGLEVSDVDSAATSVVQLTIAGSNVGDTLFVVEGTSGVVVVSGNGGSNSVVVSGTLAQINSLLASTGAAGSITYNHAGGSSTAGVTLTISDEGSTGSGGALTASLTVPITVDPGLPGGGSSMAPNSKPIGADNNAVQSADSVAESRVMVQDVLFSQADPADNLTAHMEMGVATSAESAVVASATQVSSDLVGYASNRNLDVWKFTAHLTLGDHLYWTA
jgi:large repetitive protein